MRKKNTTATTTMTTRPPPPPPAAPAMTATLLLEPPELDGLDVAGLPVGVGVGLDGPVTGGVTTVTGVVVWPDATSAVLSALLDESAVLAAAAADVLVVATVT